MSILPPRSAFDSQILLDLLWPLDDPEQELFLLTDSTQAGDLVSRARDSGLSCVCLWDGSIPPNLLEQAPWLVKLEWTQEQSRSLALESYQRRAGLFIQTSCSAAELRLGLAVFSGLEAAGQLRFFAFYQAAAFPAFVEAIRPELRTSLFEGIDACYSPGTSPDRILRFELLPDHAVSRTEVHLPTGHELKTRLEVSQFQPAGPSGSLKPAGSPVAGTGSLIIRNSQMRKFEIERLFSVIGSARRLVQDTPLRLSEMEWNAIQQARRRGLAELLEQNLREQHPGLAANYSEADLETMIETSLRRADSHGLTDQKHIFEFAKLMFLIAPNFDENPKARSILTQPSGTPEARFDQLLREMDFSDWQQAQGDARMDAWELPELP